MLIVCLAALLDRGGGFTDASYADDSAPDRPSRVGISFVVDIPPTAFGYDGLSYHFIKSQEAEADGFSAGVRNVKKVNAGVVGGVLPHLPPREWLEVDILGKNRDGTPGPAMVCASENRPFA